VSKKGHSCPALAFFTRSLVEVQRFWYQLGNAAFRLQQQVRLTGGEQLTI
jgi:hypothetical protein